MAGFDMKDYVDVSERIAVMAAKYPESSLQSELHEFRSEDGNIIGWFCRASAYRTPDDPRPGVGHAFEPVPGKTPYTKDSEAMNAETSAWGRAIVALGFPTKKIASANEVQARQPEQATPKTAKAAPQTGVEANLTSPGPMEKRLYELCIEFNPNLPIARVKDKVDAQRDTEAFEQWLGEQVAKMETSLNTKRLEAQEERDRLNALALDGVEPPEAQVESEPAFKAPTGRRGEKAAA